MLNILQEKNDKIKLRYEKFRDKYLENNQNQNKTKKKISINNKVGNKRKVFNEITSSFKDFEFFNVVCGNVFNNFLSVGCRTENEVDTLMKLHLEGFEYHILSVLIKLDKGTLIASEGFKLLEESSLFKNLFYFLSLLKKLSWEQFCKFSDKLNRDKKSNITLMTIDTLKKILQLKNLIKSFSEGFISEGHFKIAIKKYRLNKNLSSILINTNISKYLEMGTNEYLDFHLIFSNITIGYYDSVISKYSKYSIYSTSLKKDLSLFLKKKRWIKLNANKNSGGLTYAHSLALAYIGDPVDLPYARKPINLKYRAYRIFLYTFKFKPFKLWQLTRKSRDYKYGGLLVDHLSKYELTIQNILLMSNFCANLDEVKLNLRLRNICINGKIIISHSYVVRPFEVVHFNENVFRQERNRFLLNITTANLKNIFKNEFSQLFEYNFKTFSFLMLPNFFKYRKGVLAPYYTLYNSGRFRIEKI